MRRCPTIRAILPTLLACAGVARAEQHFRLVDQLGPREIAEEVTFSIDGTQIASFRLDPANPAISIDVAAPDGANHQYRMCGKVITRDRTGEIRSHIVDTSGTLGPLGGRVIAAMTNDFESYFLQDLSTGLPPLAIERNQGRGCTPVIS